MEGSKNRSYTGIYIFLSTITVRLLAILFKDQINGYLKTKEVLQRANVFNIPIVSAMCDGDFESEEFTISPECRNALDEYEPKTNRWIKLIKQNRNLGCSDFLDKKDAISFYHYIGGELAAWVYKGFNRENQPIIAIDQNFDGHCRYDPYGLDTDGDCNACESYE